MQVVVALFDCFTALDAVGPYEVLSRLPGASVVFAATTAGPVRTDTGSLAIVADAALSKVTSCDVLVVPGGPGTRAAVIDKALVDWVAATHAKTAWTTSVCTGSEILGAAGLLNGLEATTHWSRVAALESYGATYSERRVVQQGKIVTAAGVSAGIDMALTLAGLIAGIERAKAIQVGIEYDPQPPFDAGSVTKAGPEIVDLVLARATSR
jgi:putative intracellular protease/amidase